MMQRILLTVLGVVLLSTAPNMSAQVTAQDSILTALKTIDPEILQYFPRWRVCEPDLQVQIYQTFSLMGFPKENLDKQNIVVTSAPIKEGTTEPEYDLILVECGSERMVASEIAQVMRKLSYRISDPKRPYCHQDIPPADPPSAPQIAEIINYMEPTNVTHAFTMSAFEQALKIGTTGFWLKSSIGTDAIGYHYWESGEGRLQIQRPLYVNEDVNTRRSIPYLINARVGAGYRMTQGLEGQNNVLDFVKGRQLNGTYGGKIVGGLDFHMPFKPEFGFGVNLELPLQKITSETDIDETTWYQYDIGNRFVTAPEYNVDPIAIVPVLRSTGQFVLFYNWWLDRKRPENFFRFDLGVNYAEVQEVGLFKDTVDGRTYLGRDGVTGLNTWKPNEAMDWIYAKIEYRNQSVFPFGLSLQISNQVLLGRAYVPVVGDWLYVEARYSTPVIRDIRPFEVANFFMVSPVLRLNF